MFFGSCCQNLQVTRTVCGSQINRKQALAVNANSPWSSNMPSQKHWTSSQGGHSSSVKGSFWQMLQFTNTNALSLWKELQNFQAVIWEILKLLCSQFSVLNLSQVLRSTKHADSRQVLRTSWSQNNCRGSRASPFGPWGLALQGLHRH